MDESDHDMVNRLTQQIGTLFNRLIQNKNNTYQQLAHQMGQLFYFFGVPQAPMQPIPKVQGVGTTQN